ncbi:PadR family transcriptional regulator [Saccharibacillus alkalitolerans]|uniref:PadR family transcriptional regulator n=1 Tax=Saccharibacillus alkalitolerans TaxID=2705290 RepID=A0ABX0F942_9BACL|nr:PadR family transcriptional regulator [Saccharibacillus alkalitolerans]NGZ77481.1 PadR family transcriptional regulator [Saccharibacillus alkalitolerans]
MMVLGLLQQFGPMSGYEIQQMMNSAQTETWASVNPASIYHALKKLQGEGKVVLEAVEQTGMRTKTIFKITLDGEAELRELILQGLGRSALAFPTEFYTALTFANQLGKSEILGKLDEQEQEVRRLYADMKSGSEQKKAAFPDAPLPWQVEAIFEHIYEQCELQLRTLDRIRRILGGEAGSEGDRRG